MNEREIFLSALDIEPPDERARFLDDACADDARMRERVTGLLQSLHAAGNFMESAAYKVDRVTEGADEPESAAPAAADREQGVERSVARDAVSEPRIVGDFRLLREIGRGGMGVVYEAEQIALSRCVALKVLPSNLVSDATQLLRFKNEARAAASLDHPHLVSIYSIGSAEGIHYFAMQYVDGPSVADLIADEIRRRSPGIEQAKHASGSTIDVLACQAIAPQRFDDPTVDAVDPSDFATGSCRNGGSDRPQNRANGSSSDFLTCLPAITSAGAGEKNRQTCVVRLAIQAASALEHAHRMGIVHRDIKPSNLMVDRDGQLQITDFGLAIVEGDANVTASGTMIGTLRYMSPEQMRGDRHVLDHHTDIYSLGVTLYEMLTLRPAFPDEELPRLMQQIQRNDPVRIRKLNPVVHKDLETVVMKAMARDARYRYNSAAELGADLTRYVNDEPIVAKRPSPMVICLKWARRHRGIVATASAMLAITIVITGILLWRQRAQTLAAFARLTREQSATALQKQVAVQQAERARKQEQLAEEAVALSQQLLYVRGLSSTEVAWRHGDGVRAAGLLRQNPAYAERLDLRGYEWRYLVDQILPSHVVLSSDSEGKQAVCYSPDGKQIAFGGSRGTIQIWDARNHQCLRSLGPHNSQVTTVTYHPSGNRLVSGHEDGTTRIWDVSTGRFLRFFRADDVADVYDVRFSPDGKTLATCGEDCVAKLWTADGSQRIRTFCGHAKPIRTVRFSPDGKLLATGSNDTTVKIWEISSGQLLQDLRGHEGMVFTVAFTPGGKQLVSGSNDNTIRVWDLTTGHWTKEITGHLDGIDSVEVSADGKYIAAGDRGGAIRFWPLNLGSALPRIRDRKRIRDNVVAIALSPDDHTWAALSRRQLVIRDSNTKNTVEISIDLDYPDHWPLRHNLAFSPDAAHLACVNQLYQREQDGSWSRKIVFDVPGRREKVAAVSFSPDGNTLAIGIENRKVTLWDTRSGELLQTINLDSAPKVLRFSHNPQWLAIGCRDGHLVLHDRVHNSQHLLHGHSGDILNVVFTETKDQLFTFSPADRMIKWWDVHTGDLLHDKVLPPIRQTFATLSPDGKYVGTTSHRGVVRLFRLTEDYQLAHHLSLYEHDKRVDSLIFSRDGTKALTGCNSRDVIFWNIDRRNPVSKPRSILLGHTDRVNQVAWSPDGDTLVSAGSDGNVWIWHPFKTIRRLLANSENDPIMDFALTKQGRLLVTGNATGVHYWTGSTQTPLTKGPKSQGTTIVCIAVAKQGTMQASGFTDGLVTVRDTSSTNSSEEAGFSFRAHDADSGIEGLAFSHDGKILVTASHLGNELCVWNSKTGDSIVRLPAEDCDTVAFSPDGRFLAFSDCEAAVIVDVQNWQEVVRLIGHSLPVNHIAFSRDGNQLATVGEDRKIGVWDTTSWKQCWESTFHRASVRSVAFSPDGKTLASGARDGTIELWHVATGQEIFPLPKQSASIEKLAFTSDGNQLLCLLRNGLLVRFEARE